MQRLLSVIIVLSILTGCRETGIRGFWDEVPLMESNLRVSEDRYVDFAELTTKVPAEDALAEFDNLYERLRQDTMAYYLYSEWLEGAFYSIYSPCRNAALFSRGVEHLIADGILAADEYEPFVRKRDWMQLNLKGERAVVPGVETAGRCTLVLVLDITCPTCRQALTTLGSNPDYAGARHIAVCYGQGSQSGIPDWEFVFPENFTSFFDSQMTPVYFVVNETGEVEQSYSLAL